MSPMLVGLLQQGLVLCLLLALPPLLGAALLGGGVDFVQGRLGMAEGAPPALARLCGGLLGLLLAASWLGGEVARYAASLWALLPAVGR